VIPALDYSQLLGLVVALVLFFWLVSRFEQPVQRILSALVDLVAIPVRLAHEATTSISTYLLHHGRAAATKPDPTGPTEWVGWPIVGAFFSAAIVLINMYAEMSLLLMTLPLLGFAFAAVSLPQDAALLTAVAILSLGVYWGGLLSESIGLTHLTPWRRRGRRDRMVLGLLSVGVLAAILWSTWQIGRVRGFQMGFQPEDYAAVDPLEADVMAADSTWDPAHPSIAASPVTSSTLASPSAVAADRPSAEYQELERDLPVHVNGVLAVLGGLTFITGKWSLTHSLAYLVSLVLSMLWLLVWPVQFLVRALHEMLTSIQGHLLPSFTNLSHLGASDVLSWYTSRRDEAFERDAASIQAAAETYFDELAEQSMRAAASSNGRPVATPEA
jgi:hypothetical protein